MKLHLRFAIMVIAIIAAGFGGYTLTPPKTVTLTTTLPAVTITTTITSNSTSNTAGWREVATFALHESGQTESFTISGEFWKIEISASGLKPKPNVEVSRGSYTVEVSSPTALLTSRYGSIETYGDGGQRGDVIQTIRLDTFPGVYHLRVELAGIETVTLRVLELV